MKLDNKRPTTEKRIALGDSAVFSPCGAFVCLGLATAHASTVYITADNVDGTNLFGTLNVATGQFSQIATTDPVFLGLTNGPGGKIYGADINSGHFFTISTSGATTQYGSVTPPNGFYGLAYSRSAGKFFADDLSPTDVTLHSITGDGNSSSIVGQLAGLAISFSAPEVTCILTSQVTWLTVATRHSTASILPPAR